GGGDPAARQVLDFPVPSGRGRVAETGRSEAQCQPLMHRRAGLPRQIPSGDAEVELTRSDIHRDVLGPQEKELHVVLGGDRHTQSRGSVAVARCHHSFRYTSSRVSPRAIIITCAQYSSWLSSSASASSDSCSAANHTSPASSRIFLPTACTPPSSAATVRLPGGRVRARSPSSANSSSKVFPATDCFMGAWAKSRRFQVGQTSSGMSSRETPLVSRTHLQTKTNDRTAHSA